MDRVQKGDGGEWQIFLRSQSADGSWWQVADLPDKCVQAVLGTDALYLLSRRDAPHGQVLRLPLTSGTTVADADAIVPTGDSVIEDLAVTRDTVWVVDMDGGPQQVRAFDHHGRAAARGGDPADELGVVVLRSSLDAGTGPGRLVAGVLHRAGHLVGSSRRGEAPPADRTEDDYPRRPVRVRGDPRVRHVEGRHPGPLNVIAAPGTPRDGTAPALLTAYGGYSISLVPRFDPELLLWLEQGGVYVVANIRGGGEYGEEWHHAGRLATKQNCFDDFIACADHLTAAGITSRERLAIMGGSNGGLLMGAVLTQRPDIARAVVAAVPVMDSLRSETTTNGRFNTTEFGTVEDPALFTALLAYSPYHNVADGTGYPAVLLTAGRERHPGRRLARQEDDGPAPGGNVHRAAGAAEIGVRPATSPGRSTRPSTRQPTGTPSCSTS